VKPPFQKDAQFLAEVHRNLQSGAPRLWWLGQSGFLIVNRRRAILLDPYLSDSLTKKYATTDKPHVRITERVVDPAPLGDIGIIELIASTHNHTDHFDPDTLVPLLVRNPDAPLVLPEANRKINAERLNQILNSLLPVKDWESRMIGLDAGTSANVAGIELTGIAAAHNTIERDESGHCRFLGFVIRWAGLTIYHAGDTLLHNGLVPTLRPMKIDLALLPINGNKPERRVAGNLDGPESARLAHDIGAKCVIPCHFDMFEFNTESPDRFIAECRHLGQPYRILQNGEGMDLPAPA
jgi:L-ascorbate metabolism protein UlaG (beta-lactamase superfamily)